MSSASLLPFVKGRYVSLRVTDVADLLPFVVRRSGHRPNLK